MRQLVASSGAMHPARHGLGYAPAERHGGDEPQEQVAFPTGAEIEARFRTVSRRA
ncbi:MAG: hypothetical protein IT557_01335 [Alphaproteobacteria bacterium]|nr:hypothetical protein [Alphaproteobacteria bacterium]